jgi:hypothetical protein
MKAAWGETADRPPLVALDAGEVADRDDDRDGRQQSGDDRQQDGGARRDRRDEREGEARPADRPEVVHRPLEAVRAPVRLARSGVRQLGVSGRHPQAARRPRAGAQQPHLPGRRGRAD